MTTAARPRRAARSGGTGAGKTVGTIDAAALARWPLTAPDGAADKETRHHQHVARAQRCWPPSPPCASARAS
jgi:hypothetical protein